MAKKPASTNLTEEIWDRVTRVAKVDRRSISEVLEICVELGLPEMERDVQHKIQSRADAKGGQKEEASSSKQRVKVAR